MSSSIARIEELQLLIPATQANLKNNLHPLVRNKAMFKLDEYEKELKGLLCDLEAKMALTDDGVMASKLERG